MEEWVAETGGLEKEKRSFAILLKIQLIPLPTVR
jgi:hypothetical protein